MLHSNTSVGIHLTHPLQQAAVSKLLAPHHWYRTWNTALSRRVASAGCLVQGTEPLP